MVANRANNSTVFRSFSIASDTPLQLTEEQTKLLQKYPLESLEMRTIVSGDLVQSDQMGEYFKKSLEENNVISISSSWNDQLGLFASAGRVQFSQEEIADKKKVVILPSNFGNSLDFPEKIILMGQEFQVIGVQAGYTSEFFIPSSTYHAQGLESNLIYFTLENRLSQKDEKKFVEELYQSFPNSKLKSPSDASETLEEGTIIEILFVSIVYLLSMFSFMFLIKFLMDAHSAENITYFLVGAKKRVVIEIIMIQNLILILCSALIGIGIHLSLKDNVFALLNYSPNVQYSFIDYLIITMIMLVVSAIIQIPFLWNYYRKSLIQLKQKYIMGD